MKTTLSKELFASAVNAAVGNNEKLKGVLVQIWGGEGCRSKK